MNAKLCKKLRSIAHMLTPNMPRADYTQAKGKWDPRRQIELPGTIRLTPRCFRGQYHALKREVQAAR